MDAGRLHSERKNNEPPARKPKSVRTSTIASRWPITFKDTRPVGLRLGQGFGSSVTGITPLVQAKLTINEPGDHFEQEADRVAEQVMRMPEPGLRLHRTCGCAGTNSGCECGNSQLQVQRRPMTDASATTAAPSVVHDVLRMPGQSLDQSTRAFFEPRFQQNLGHIRIHTDSAAAASAQAINARAYTVGSDVVFGANQYAPETSTGRNLLAHELAHTLQQGTNHSRIQRQPVQGGCSTLHPENCITFESWLARFAGVPTFAGSFIQRGRDIDPQQVIGERAPTTIPTPPPARLRGDTQGIERPWAGWLRANLPPTLIETAYELPTDCADIVLILRHVWLNAHGRTEQVRAWTLGRGVSRSDISGITGAVSTGTFKQGMIAFYRDANGSPIRSFPQLLPLLHPGDVLIWEHRNARGERSGGHSETIDRITHAPNVVITTLQGNKPLTGRLGSLPGWRIERGGIDAGDMRDINGVWTWADGTTVLIGAGPWGGTPQARSRPPSPRRGTTARVLRDWTPSLSSATIAQLAPVLESALGEARAVLEGQRNVPETEARQVGEQIGRRLWTLAHQARDLGVASHFEPLQQLLSIIEAYRLTTRPTGTSTQSVINTTYSQIREALELGARGASSLQFRPSTGQAPGSTGTRRVNILLTGFDPFEPGGSLTRPDRELWNTSGAAAMALDGEDIPAGRRIVAAVESVVLPVDFRSFATGMVEAIARPLLPMLDAVMTVSMDPGLTGQAALERFAVNFHHVSTPIPASGSTPRIESGPIPLPPVTGGGAAPAAGPAILPSWSQLDTLASSVRSTGGGISFFARSSPLQLRFGTPQLAQGAMQDMGLSSATEHDVNGREVTFCADSDQMTSTQRANCEATSINRLLGVARTPAGQPANRLRWPAFQTANTNFEADVESGPGGSFLSNEVSYRMLRLLQQQGSAAASFHTHTPNAPRVPVAERTDRHSAARAAAMRVRSSVISGLRNLIIRVAQLLRP